MKVEGFHELLEDLLRAMADVMVAAGYVTECSQMFLVAQRNAFDARLQGLGYRDREVDVGGTRGGDRDVRGPRHSGSGMPGQFSSNCLGLVRSVQLNPGPEPFLLTKAYSNYIMNPAWNIS